MIVKKFTTVAAQQELMRHIGGGGGELGQQAGLEDTPGAVAVRVGLLDAPAAGAGEDWADAAAGPAHLASSLGAADQGAGPPARGARSRMGAAVGVAGTADRPERPGDMDGPGVLADTASPYGPWSARGTVEPAASAEPGAAPSTAAHDAVTHLPVARAARPPEAARSVAVTLVARAGAALDTAGLPHRL
ncbi:hypothetical protein [Streptomyces sp. NPDC059552]|uniref:hypothetical protein n=1 Tax=Streptomyces sp. NPDC059552 TaxID=3346862 RepID=UPI0036D1ADE9